MSKRDENNSFYKSIYSFILFLVRFINNSYQKINLSLDMMFYLRILEIR